MIHFNSGDLIYWVFNIILSCISIMAQINIKNIAGKGNAGCYIDRFPKIYAAGIRTLQPSLRISECFNSNTIQSFSDVNQHESLMLPRLKSARFLANKDMRNAGLYTEGSELINPPVTTKFGTLIQDLKNTVHDSRWKKECMRIHDLESVQPSGNHLNDKTFGKVTKSHENAYDIIFPSDSIPRKSLSIDAGNKLDHKYCKPPFHPDKVYGMKTNLNKTNTYIKSCLSDKRVIMGTSLREPIHIAQEKFQQKNRSELGMCLTPNKNINRVPEGHVFGKVQPKDNIIGCFTTQELNPERELLKKCLGHLNTLRKTLSKRFDGLFFRNLYLELKFLDRGNDGWLPKETIYQLCTAKYIQFNSNLIEHLMLILNAFNDSKIEYATFIKVIDYREPLPLLPKISDIAIECNVFTTYTEMVNSQEVNNAKRAGIPSGRYMDKDYPVTPDGCCKADRIYLPQESDAKACLCPSIFTLLGISHRDMYAAREPDVVKRVFKGAGEKFSIDTFQTVWKDAMKYHPKGLVCYETFRRALKEYKIKSKLS